LKALERATFLLNEISRTSSLSDWDFRASA
jgi:hypothetical protein